MVIQIATKRGILWPEIFMHYLDVIKNKKKHKWFLHITIMKETKRTKKFVVNN
jgi:hypothetical protein